MWRPRDGSGAEVLKEEMVDVIVIFSYFWLSLQLWTDLLFTEKEVPVPFLYVSWAVSCGCAFLWVTKMWNVSFCAVYFFICIFIFLLLAFMKPPFTWPFDVMKTKWLRMFPFAYIKLVNVTFFNHRLTMRSEYHYSFWHLCPNTSSMFLNLSTNTETSLCMRCFSRKRYIYQTLVHIVDQHLFFLWFYDQYIQHTSVWYHFVLAFDEVCAAVRKLNISK